MVFRRVHATEPENTANLVQGRVIKQTQRTEDCSWQDADFLAIRVTPTKKSFTSTYVLSADERQHLQEEVDGELVGELVWMV